MKGVHPILSHSVLLIIGLAAMGMIIVSVSSTMSTTRSNLVRAETEYLSEAMRAMILEVYGSVNRPGNFSGTFGMDFPETVGDQKYVVVLSGNTLTIRLPVDNNVMEVSRVLDIDASISGEKGMPASLAVEKTGETITMDLI
jgi:hypothetical protein